MPERKVAAFDWVDIPGLSAAHEAREAREFLHKPPKDPDVDESGEPTPEALANLTTWE